MEFSYSAHIYNFLLPQVTQNPLNGYILIRLILKIDLAILLDTCIEDSQNVLKDISLSILLIEIYRQICCKMFSVFIFFLSLGGHVTLKGLSATFFLCMFFKSKREDFETREKVFYFTLKALFILEKIKFKNLRYSSFITSSNARYLYQICISKTIKICPNQHTDLL